MARSIITTDEIRAVQAGSTLTVPAGAIVTDLARELAEANQIHLEFTNRASPVPNKSDVKPIIAIGSDHGPSFPLKESLKPFLEEAGYTVLDCGTYSPDSVDYPDIAYSVAKQVANGSAWRGIIIDGAGIGSSMAANKVPGVRAALCYNQAMAHNSREHNNANVLTLGAGMIGSNLARQIIKVWLETDFGGGRHARRVDKITQIEQRFLRE
ncbi:MAG: ribose 5-phosphate isomerase B [Anaerolineae bacterium]|nr:ribose 5-phosphate isomerase B [Anaerolineae bacterium]